jgi:hypothetical protein
MEEAILSHDRHVPLLIRRGDVKDPGAKTATDKMDIDLDVTIVAAFLSYLRFVTTGAAR